MLIQCHSCNTKYRLNLEQIPRRKTFVRCKNCGTPIYIDPTEDAAPASGVIPPPPGAVPRGDAPRGDAGPLTAGEPEAAPVQQPAPQAPAPELVQVVCPSCSSRYRIPAASVQRPGVKMKCTQCGHLFAPPPDLHAPPPPPHPAPEPAAGRPQEMPLPDEGDMEHLFDDLRPGEASRRAGGEPPASAGDTELGSLEGVPFEDEPPVPDSDQAYLDAVALEDDGEVPPGGTVPEDQKYRFFLNPRAYEGSDKRMADRPEDKTPGAPPPEAEQAGGTDWGAGDVPDLPPQPSADELPPLPSTEVVQSREEMERLREVVPGQDARVFTEKRVLAIVAAAALVILVGTGAWGYWLASSSGTSRPYAVRLGQPHQLALENDLEGHYVTNEPSGRRLFVVDGELENRFPPDTQVRWIRLKGIAYAGPDQSETLGTAYAYAGNTLSDDQLSQWELPAIKAYYGFTNGRRELNLSIPAGARVPYQLVFTDVEGQVGRTVAQIVSYHRQGQAMFVEMP